MSTLLFLYREVLGIEIERIEGIARARRHPHLPVVPGRQEVDLLLSSLQGTARLVASLLYGSDLRLLECHEGQLTAAPDGGHGTLWIYAAAGERRSVNRLQARLQGYDT